MSQEEYFEYIDHNESAQKFLNNFGGEFAYNLNYGFVYVYDK